MAIQRSTRRNRCQEEDGDEGRVCRGTERSRARPSVLDALVEPLRSLSLRQRTTTPWEIDDPGPGVPQTEQPKPRSSGLPDTRRFLGYLHPQNFVQGRATLVSR